MYVQVLILGLVARVAIELLTLLISLVGPILILLVMNPHPSAENYIAILSGQMQIFVGYLAGKAAVAVCGVAVSRQLETQQQSYDEFFNFLHSHVKAGIASIKVEQPNVKAMLRKLDELEQAVSDRRIEMLFVRDQIPLAVVISERTRTFTGRLAILESPRVGALTVARPIGILISRTLGDLLKNVVIHGGNQVRIRCSVDDNNVAVVTVIDNGPGFDPAILDDPTKSLHRLQSNAQIFGGDLTMQVTSEGTVMRLVLPLR